MAGWDEFLTEQDKQHLSIWGKPERDGLGDAPVVLVIDVYYRAVGHERKPLLESIKDWPSSCGLEGWQAIDRMASVLAAARAQNVPVIYSRSLPGFPNDKLKLKKYGKGSNRSGDLLPEIAGLANEIVAEVAPQPGEWVMGKTAASAFAGTPLLQHLRSLGTDTLIVCGETTSGCVRATVVDGSTYRYRMGIVGECCFDRTQASHWINLFDMDQKYGDVIDVQTVVDYFSALKKKYHDRREL